MSNLAGVVPPVLRPAVPTTPMLAAHSQLACAAVVTASHASSGLVIAPLRPLNLGACCSVMKYAPDSMIHLCLQRACVPAGGADA